MNITSALKSVFALCAFMAMGLAAPSYAQNADAGQNNSQNAEQPQIPVSYSNLGGHIMGDSNAPVAIVEYMSYTCPHCATFELQSHEAMNRKYLQTSKASFEIRNLILNPADLAAALLARCGAKEMFYENHRMLLLNQSQWVGNMQKLAATHQDRWRKADYRVALVNLAEDIGLIDMMKTRNINRSSSVTCLQSNVAINKIMGMSDHAKSVDKIFSTPSFTKNGVELANVHSWDLLDKAIAGQ